MIFDRKLYMYSMVCENISVSISISVTWINYLVGSDKKYDSNAVLNVLLVVSESLINK